MNDKKTKITIGILGGLLGVSTIASIVTPIVLIKNNDITKSHAISLCDYTSKGWILKSFDNNLNEIFSAKKDDTIIFTVTSVEQSKNNVAKPKSIKINSAEYSLTKTEIEGKEVFFAKIIVPFVNEMKVEVMFEDTIILKNPYSIIDFNIIEWDIDSLCNDSTDITGKIISTGKPFSSIKRNEFNYKIYFPTSLKVIPDNFMSQCTNFDKEIELPNGITEIGSYFLFHCAKFNHDITIPNSVKNIKASFLGACSEFNSNIIFEEESNLETIGQGFIKRTQFSGSLRIPASVTKIEKDFCESTSIQKIYLDSSTKIVTFPDIQNFMNGSRLEYDNTKIVNISNCWFNNNVDAVIYASNDFTGTFPTSTKYIGDWVLSNTGFNKNITFSENLLAIGGYFNLASTTQTFGAIVDFSQVDVSKITIAADIEAETGFFANKTNVTFKVKSGTTQSWKNKILKNFESWPETWTFQEV